MIKWKKKKNRLSVFGTHCKMAALVYSRFFSSSASASSCVCQPALNSSWQCRHKEKQRHLSVWSRTIKGEGHIAYHIDICPIEACNYLLVMTLLSPAPSERLRRMRPQGVLPPCAREIAGGIPHMYPLSLPQHVLLCPHADWGMRKLCKLVALLCREDGWYLFSIVLIIQPNAWHCIYRWSDLCWTSSWHWKHTSEQVQPCQIPAGLCTLLTDCWELSEERYTSTALCLCCCRINKRGTVQWTAFHSFLKYRHCHSM